MVFAVSWWDRHLCRAAAPKRQPKILLKNSIFLKIKRKVMHSFNRMKLKVCGMRHTENIRAVAALRPDYMGFIFYPLSKMAVGNDFQIPDVFPQRIKKVTVFVNEETAD